MERIGRQGDGRSPPPRDQVSATESSFNIIEIMLTYHECEHD